MPVKVSCLRSLDSSEYRSSQYATALSSKKIPASTDNCTRADIEIDGATPAPPSRIDPNT